MSAVTMPPMMTDVIAFDYRATGEVQCKNQKGMVFFLRPAAPPPAPKTWTAVEATKEAEIKRHAEPQSMTELQRSIPQAAVAESLPAASFKAVEATHEVEVRRAEPAVAPAARGTAPLPDVPAPGQAPQKGWFGKLFGK
jgi:hypothetical protein